jgi:hypothetical protein
MMKMRSVLVVLSVIFLGACTRQNVNDTGISNPHFKGTIMQYLRADDYNWKLTVQMIERGGLVDLFEGKVDSLKEITFLGFTSHSVLRYLLDRQMDSVKHLTPEFCRATILKHVIKGKTLKIDIPYRDKQFYVYDSKQPVSGYKTFITLGGREVRAYLEKTSYGPSPDNGPVVMYCYSMSIGLFIPLASPDIQPSNGVVHSLNYNFNLNNI